MTPYVSEPEDLALHGPRVLGFATASRIARRYGLDAEVVGELLLDHEAKVWVQPHEDLLATLGLARGPDT